MKFKRILSVLLAAIILSTAVIAAFPAAAFAANHAEFTGNGVKANMYAATEEAFSTPRDLAKQIRYSSALDMLKAEIAADQLMYATSDDGVYSVFVNVYTGFMYYRNNVTGQVLMSNSYDYTNTSNPNASLLSQIEVEFSAITTSTIKEYFNSYNDAALYNQIYVTKMENGLRVNYTLGDTTTRFLVPGAISQDRFLNNLMLPMMSDYMSQVAELALMRDQNLNNASILTRYLNYYKFTSGAYSDSTIFNFAAIVMGADNTAINKDNSDFVAKGYRDEFNARFRTFYDLIMLDEMAYYCKECSQRVEADWSGEHVCPDCGDTIEGVTNAELLFYRDNGQLNTDAITEYLNFVSYYVTYILFASNPIQDVYAVLRIFAQNYRLTDDGTYVKCNIKPDDYYTLESVQEVINTYCVYVDEPTYSFNELYRDEKEWGYVHPDIRRPVFRCALEYTFNDDGTLCISLPANSISFDESAYILRSITPLKYFGSGSLVITDENGDRSGHFFYPDGSGTIVKFDDFTSRIISFSAPVFGIDHAYSDIVSITGDYREQITMPVYGSVFTENLDSATAALVGTKTANNGFFAVIEEGAALAKLNFALEGTTSRFAAIFPKYQPYPSDTYDLSTTISVSGLSEYTMVSATKFNGTYTTRISMLTDARISDAYGYPNYVASYTGMASCYRDYLKATGAIEAIADLGEDLPLYIEAFGSMEITKKILSFPVEVSIPLTTFEDVRTMYDELADAKNMILAKAKDYEGRAAAEEKDLELKALYVQKSEEYYALAEKIVNITNINFRLTGFANGGMAYTYPSKVKWDKVVGGKDGFEELLAYSKTVSAKTNATLGIYPEFDFLYISNTAMFDGIYPNGISSKLIDNRYAEKQLYNSVAHMYETTMIQLVSADSLAELYTKFNEDYSEYGIKAISVSTLGSDVNSNFDDDEPVNRDEARQYISEILASMKGEGYEIMVNKGNSYTYDYASHIVDAYVDSSHLRYASYTIPFFGMTLHSYIGYAGNALNYSGDPSYDILRSIENGASLYYILCYQNTAEMKDDLELNKYYGVDYATWFENVVEQYATINEAIGDLQSYEIVDHRILIAERLVDSKERADDYSELILELVTVISTQIDADIRAAFAEMKEQGVYGKGVKVEIDVEAIVSEADQLLNLVNNIQISDKFAEEVRETIRILLKSIEDEFNATYEASDDPYIVKCDSVDEYESRFDYVTDSVATDGSKYDETEYTVQNYNVVMVTYRNAATGHEVTFILNYNIYGVVVTLEGGESFVLDKYDYKKIA